LHMLQWDPPATAAGAPPWVTVWAPEADNAYVAWHPQAGARDWDEGSMWVLACGRGGQAK
jgi:hypothetical protein